MMTYVDTCWGCGYIIVLTGKMAEVDQSKITVYIKSTKHKLDIQMLPSQKVIELKEQVKERLGDDLKGEICLIFAGKILKDEDTLESHGIVKSELTIHLVMRPAKNSSSTTSTASSSTSTTATTTTTTTGSTPSSSQSSVPAGGMPHNPFGMMGGPEMGGPQMQAQMQQLMANPEMMREIMDSPLMQGLLSNPEALQNLFASNPQMQQLMERNPELSHILNNPDLMRQAMEMASNPSAMREMMRSQDRQLSNIESLPGGFNALARMYSEVQEPMMDAAQETLQQQLQNNPFAALFNSQDNTPQPGPTAPPGTTNTTPLPNPWGPTNQSNASRPNSTSNTGGNNRTNTGPQTGGGANGSGQNNYMSQMMQMMQSNPELMSQLGGGTSSSNHLAMLQNPAYQQMLSQMMQNPEMRRVMMETMQNPAMMQNLPPSLQSMYSNNPESMSQMMNLMSNPQALQGMMRMMEGYQQMVNASPGAAGLFGTGIQQPTNTSNSGSTGNSGSTSNTSSETSNTGSGTSSGQFNDAMTQQLLQMLSGQMPSPGGPTTNGTSGASTTQMTPEERAATRYSVQLNILEGMGFLERAANIQALIEANGDINGAIDRLLNRF